MQLVVFAFLALLIASIAFALDVSLSSSGTAGNATYQNYNWVFVNASVINTTTLDTVLINWNGTNVTVDSKDLVLNMHFNNVTDNNFTLDSSRYNNSGQLFGFNQSNASTSGRLGNALTFDRNDDYVEVAASESLNQLTNNFSVMAWVNSKAGCDQTQGVVEKNVGGDVNTHFAMFIYSTGGTWFRVEKGGSLYTARSDSCPATNTWFHVTGVYNGAEVSVWVNGVKQGWVDNVSAPIDGGSGTLQIGRNPTTTYFFNGSIDDIRIWNRTLTPAEINASYQAEIGRYYANFTNLTDGNYTFYSYVNETNGSQMATETRQLIVDTVAPTISYAAGSTANATTTKNTYAYINTTTSDINDWSAFINWNNSLVGYWRFEEGSGTNASDNSSYNNHGTLTNFGCTTLDCNASSGWVSNGKRGKAVTFDGINEYIVVPYSESLNVSTLTVSAWIKLIDQTSNWPDIVTRQDVFRTELQGGVQNTVAFSVLNTSRNVHTVGSGILSNGWHFITGTFDGSTVSLYIDGSLAQSGAVIGEINRTKDALLIGANGAGVENFNGSIDEAQVWNRALTGEEINASYSAGAYRLNSNFTGLSDGNYSYYAVAVDAAGTQAQTETRTLTIDATTPTITLAAGTPGNATTTKWNYAFINTTTTEAAEHSAYIDWNRSLVGYWNFEEFYNSSNFTSNSSYTNTGTISGFGCTALDCNASSGWISAGKRGKGLNFDGQNDYVNASGGNSLNITSNFTVELWVYSNQPLVTSVYVSKGEGSAGKAWFFAQANGKYGFENWGEGMQNFGVLGTVTTGWHHLVAIANKTGNQNTTIYLDGNLLGMINHSVLLTDVSGTLAIGRRSDDSSSYFNGSIDEVKIWNRALSAEEINASYNAQMYRLQQNYTGLVNGNYSYYAVVVDSAGSQAQTETRTLTVDIIAPTIGYAYPTPDTSSSRNTSWVIVNVSVNDSQTEYSAFIDFNRSLVGYWNFEELYNSSNFTSNSSYTNTGTISGFGCTTLDCNASSGWISAGKRGKAITFDSENDYVNAGKQASMSITGAITLEAWVNPKGIIVGSTNSVVDKWNVWGIRVQDTWKSYIQTTDCPSPSDCSAEFGTVPINTWTHMALTFDGTNIIAYKNGLEVNRSYHPGTVSTSDNNVWIGHDQSGGNQYFNGSIDEVKIWNRALTPQEINASYKAGLVGFGYGNMTGLVDSNYSYYGVVVDSGGSQRQTAVRTLSVDATTPTINYGYDWVPANNTYTSQNWAFINTSITDSNAEDFKINWNGTNITAYDDSLVLLMHFNTVNPNNWTDDDSRYNNSGQLINFNGTTMSAGDSNLTKNGKFDDALSFDGINDYVSIANSASLNLTEAITIGAWVKFSSTGHHQAIISKETGGTLYNYELDWETTPNLNFGFYDGSWHRAQYSWAPTIGVWYHIVGTYDKSNLRLYVNGSEAATPVSITTSMPNNTGVVSIGMQSSGSVYPFNGSIDEVRIYNRALSSAEINATYQAEIGRYYANFTNLSDGNYSFYAWINDSANNKASTETRQLVVDTVPPTISYGLSTPANASYTNKNYAFINTTTSDTNDYSAFINWNNSLVGYWRFEEGSGTNASDNTSYNNHGTLTNFGCTTQDCNATSGWTTAGKRGKGLMFDGENDQLGFATSSSLSNFSTGITLELWINPKAGYGTGYPRMIIKESQYEFDVEASTGKLEFDVNISDTMRGLFSTGSLPINVWTHIVGTYNGSAMKIYMNGAENASTSAYSGNITGAQNFQTLQISRSNRAINGSVDEVKIWNRALTGEEINASYSAGAYRLNSNFTGLSDGNYSYYAVAVDAAGTQAQTETRTLTIDATTPTITLAAGTPGNATTTKWNYAFINTTTTEAAEHSAYIDWNRSLVGYWNFEELYNSSNFTSNSSYSNTGTISGFGCTALDCNASSGWISAGKRGKAVTFDGLNDLVGLGNGTTLRPESLTLEAWIKPAPACADTYCSFIADERNNYGYLFRTQGTTLHFILGNSTYASTVQATVTSDTWTHVSGTYNNATKAITIYVNGALIQSATMIGGVVYNESAKLRLGGRDDNNYKFNGSIDEVRIWNRALTPEEINASYNAQMYRLQQNYTGLVNGNYTYYGVVVDAAGNQNQTEVRTLTVDTIAPAVGYAYPTPDTSSSRNTSWVIVNVSVNDSETEYSAYIDWNRSLVGYWNFEELINSSNFTSNSSYTNTGTISGFGCTTLDCNSSSGWTSAGKRGKALVFDGINDYVDAGNGASLKPGDSSWTVGVWFKAGTNDANHRWLWGMFTTGDSGRYSLYKRASPDNSLWVTWLDDAGNGLGDTSVTSAISADTWYYSVIVADKNAGLIKSYINGITANLDKDISTAGTLNPTHQFGIGADAYDVSNFWNGSIDEVKVWNRALTPEEINASFSAGAYRLNSNFTGLSDGNYSYYGVVVDAAGNQNQTEVRTLSIDATTPTISYSADWVPANATYTTQNWAYVNTSVTETNPKDFIINWNGTNITAYDDSLVLLMHFNTVESNNWTNDDSRYNNSGQLINFNGTVTTAGDSNLTKNGKFDDALSFDGINDYVSVENVASLNMSSEISFSAWVNLNSYSNQPVFIGKGAYGTGWYFQILSDGDIAPSMQVAGGTIDSGDMQYGPISTNQWNYYAFTYNGTHLNLYLNGLQANTTTAHTGTITTNNNPVYIGRYYDTAGYETNGSIDEVKIWNRALSWAEINATYQAEIGRYYANFTNLSDGNYSFYAWINDSSNNKASTQTRQIVVDTVKPTIDYAAGGVANATTTKNNYAYVNVSTNDVNDWSAYINWNNSLVGYWRFEEGSGTNASDNTSYNNHATLVDFACTTLDCNTSQTWGGSGWTSAGKSGKGLVLDGVTEYVNVVNSTSLQIGTNITVEVWVKPIGNTVGRIVRQEWIVYSNAVDSTQQLPAIQAKLDGAGPNTFYNWNSNMQTNKWSHLAFTYDGATFRFYLNGSQTNTAAITDRLQLGANVRIGGDPWVGGNASIDEVRIWNRVLTPQEIASSYSIGANRLNANITNLTNGNYSYYAVVVDAAGNQAQTETRTLTVDTIAPAVGYTYPTPNDNSYLNKSWTIINVSVNDSQTEYSAFIDFNRSLVGYWNFEELINSSNFTSNSSYTNTGTISGFGCTTLDCNASSGWVSNGKRGKAVTFDSENDYVSMPDSSSINPNVITFEAWVNAKSFTNDYNSVQSKESAGYGYTLLIKSNGKLAVYIVPTEGISISSDGSGTSTLSTNTWYHLAYTYDGSTLTMYVNGLIDSSATGYTGNVNNSATNLIIGDSFFANRKFNGSIDEVKIWNRALTPQEINASYKAGLVGFGYGNMTGLVDSNYSYYGVVVDSGGSQRQTAVRTLSVDLTSPVVNWINSTGYVKGNDLQNWSSSNSITFYANVTDLYGQNCTVYTNASGSWNSNATFSFNSGQMASSSPQTFADGSYLWNVSCNDTAWNVGHGSASILNVDATNLAFVNVTPAENNWTAVSAPRIVFNLTDNNLDSCTIWTNITGSWLKNYTANASQLNYSGHNFSVTFADNSYQWSIVCNDSAANTNATSNKTISIDTVLPVINWINATGYNKGNDLENWSSSNTINFYANVADLNNQSCAVYTNASGGWQRNVTFSYISNAMAQSAAQVFAEGSYKWNITCNDTTGRETSGSASTLNIDTSAPYVTNLTPSSNNWSTSSTVFFRFNTTDNNLDSCTLWTNDSLWGARNNATNTQLSGSGWNFTYTYSADGSYAWNINCNDTSANAAFNASNNTINIDTTLPTITWINATGYNKGGDPENNWSNSSSISFYVSAADNNNQSCIVYYNSSAGWAANATISNYISGQMASSPAQVFADGSYKWNITCNDTAGRRATYLGASIANIDTASPIINGISYVTDVAGRLHVAGGNSTTAATVYFNSLAGEGGNQNVTVEVNYTDKNLDKLDGSSAFSDTPINNTDSSPVKITYSIETGSDSATITVTATDKAKNIDTATITLTQDNADPATTDNSSSDYWSYWHSSSVTVNLTATDALSGTNRTYFCIYSTGLSRCNPTAVTTADKLLIQLNCSSNSACQQAIRYYSIDNVSNNESGTAVRESYPVYIATNADIDDSYANNTDIRDGAYIRTSNLTNSTVSGCRITDSVIRNSTTVYNHSLRYNCTITNSTVISTNLTSSVVTRSFIDPSTVYDSVVTNSNISDAAIFYSRVENSTLCEGMFLYEAAVLNNTLIAGRITYNSTNYYAPFAISSICAGTAPSPVGTLTATPVIAAEGANITFRYTASEVGYSVRIGASELLKLDNRTQSTIALNDNATYPDTVADDAIYSANFSISYGSNISDGNKTIVANVSDSLGNNWTVNATVVVDNTKPNATMLISNGEGSTNSREVTLTINFNDSVGVDKCRFSNEDRDFDEWEACTETKNWRLSAQEGIKTVIYQVRDLAGNINETNDTIIYTAELATTLIAPAENTYVKGNITVEATAPDSAGWVTFYVTNASTTYALTGSLGVTNDSNAADSWSKIWNTTAFVDDTYNVTAISYDANGNYIGNDTNTNITVDNTAPTLTSPLPSTDQISRTFTVNVTVNEEAACRYDTVNVAYSDMAYLMTEYDDANNKHSATATTPADGNYTIYFACIDLAGNAGTASTGVFEVVSTAPTITFTSPTPANLTYTNLTWIYINITYTAIVNNTILFNFNSTNYSDITCSQNSCFKNITNLPNGNYSFYAWMNDSAGNEGRTESRKVIVDTVAPNASIVISSGDSNTTSLSVLLRLSFNDTYLDSCRLSNENRVFDSWQACSDTVAWYLSQGAGVKTVIFQVKDRAGNIRETNDTVTYSEAKVTAIIKPLSDYKINGNYGVEITAPDTAAYVVFKIINSTRASDTWSLAGEAGQVTNDSNAADGWSQTWVTTAFTGGFYNITAISYDANGAHIANDSEGNIEIDNTAPTVAVDIPTASTAYRGLIHVNASASSDVVTTRFDYRAGTGDWHIICVDYDSPWGCDWNTAELTDAANYEVRANATDDVGLSSINSHSAVELDNTAPTITITNPVGGSEVANTINITFTIIGTTDTVQIQFDGGSWTTTTYSNWYSWDTTAYTDRTHTIRVRANDTLGNMGYSDYVVVDVNNGGMPVILIEPSSGSYKSGNVDITVSAPAETYNVTFNISNSTSFYNTTANEGVVTVDNTSSDGWRQTWVTTSFAEDSVYTITVKAYSAANTLLGTDSAITIEVDNLVPGNVTNITITDSPTDSDGVLTINWTSSASADVSYYKLYRAQTYNFSIGTGTYFKSVYGNYTTDTVSEGKWYYRVTAVDNVGRESNSSPEANVTVDISGPTGSLTLSKTIVNNNDTITLSFSGGGTGYSAIVNASNVQLLDARLMDSLDSAWSTSDESVLNATINASARQQGTASNRLYSGSANNSGYNITKDLGAGGINLANRTRITFWVMSNATGGYLQFGLGESSPSENTYSLRVNESNVWEQKVLDISTIAASSRDAIRYLMLNVTSGTAFVAHFDDVEATSQISLVDDGTGSDSVSGDAVYTASYNMSIDNSVADGNKTIRASISDGSSFFLSPSATIILDNTQPFANITINDGDTYATSTTVILKLTYSDTNAVSMCRYSNDLTWNEEWEVCTPTKSWLLGAGAGTKTVYFQAIDSAGNINQTSDTITLDLTAPIINITYPRAGDVVNDTINITFTGTENNPMISIDGADFIATTGIEFYIWNTSREYEGAHTIRVKDTDVAGNIGYSNTILVSIDNMPGTVTIISPQDNALLTGNTTIKVSVTATEDTANMSFWFYNGSDWQSLFNATYLMGGWNYTLDTTRFADGAGRMIMVNATNHAGRMFDYDIVTGLRVDNTAPVQVNLTALPTYDTDGIVALNWTPSSSDTSYYNLYRSTTENFSVSTGTLVKNITTNSTTDYPGINAKYYYKVTAVDNAGFESTASNEANTTISTAIPSGAIAANDTIVNNGGSIVFTFTSYQLDFNVSFNNSELQKLDNATKTANLVLRDDGVWPDAAADDGVYTSNYSIQPTNNNTDGTKQLTLVVNSSANNIFVTTINITLDNTKPNASITVNDNDGSTSSRTVVVSLGYNDTYGIDKCRFSNEDRDFDEWEACTEKRLWRLSSGYGTKTIAVQVLDNAGNVNETNDTIIYTAELATTILTPAANSHLKGNVTVEAVAPDTAGWVAFKVTNYSNASHTWSLTGNSGQVTNDTNAADGWKQIWNTTAFAGGKYNVTVSSYDINGAYISNDTANNITVDNSAPALTSPLPTTTQNTTVFVVNLTANEEAACRYDTANVAYPDMAYLMTEYDDANNKHSATATMPADGAYTIYFACIDPAGNVGTANTGAFTVDSGASVISLVPPTPSDNTYSSRNWAYINFSYSETNNDTAIISFNSTNYTTGVTCTAANCYINITGLADGNYTFYAWINDTAGNKAQTEERRIIIDTTSPNASITVNDNDGATVYRTVVLSLGYNDTYGIRDCRIANEDRIFTLWEECTEKRLWMLSAGDGAKTVVLQARDYANNTRETNDSITYSTSSATTLLRPEPDSYVRGNITVEAVAPWQAGWVVFRVENASNYALAGTEGITNDTAAADGFVASWNTTAFADGRYNVTAISYGVNGNYISNDTNTNITVDNTAPILTNYTPTADQRSKTFKVGINTTEEVSCRYSFSNIGYSSMANSLEKVSDYAYEATATAASDSYYTVFFACQDLAGNVGTNSTGFNVNSTAPVVTSSGPEGTVTTSTVNLTVTTDRNAFCRYNTTDMNFTQMARQFTNTGGLAHNSSVVPVQGTNTYFVRCSADAQGLNAMAYSAVIMFEYGVPVSIGTLSMNASVARNGSHIKFTFEGSSLNLNVSINASELQKLDVNAGELQLNDSGMNSDLVASDATYTAAYLVSGNNTATDGSKEIVATVTDAAGDVFRPKANITLDNTNPNASVTINSGETHTTSRIVTLNISFSDSAGIDKCRFSNEDSNWTGWQECTTARAWTLTSSARLKTVMLQVRDLAGNIKEVNDTITLVTVPITIGFALPTPNDLTYSNTTWVFINISASNTTTIDTRKISFNSTNYTAGITSAESFFYINITGLADGNYTYYAWANDSAGNVAVTETRKIIIDTLSPNASITILGTTPAGFTNASTEYTTSRLVSLVFVFNDSVNIDKCRFSNEDRNFSTWEACVSPKTWALTTGAANKTVFVQARDLAGNIREANDTIFLNETGAGLDITPPSAPTVVDDGTYTNTKYALHARWNSTDYESTLLGIPLEYEYRISYDDLSSYINSSWIYAGTSTEVTVYPLELTDGENYTFEVRAINTANVRSSTGYSDGIIVDVSSPTTPSVNGTNNGTWSANNAVSFNFSSTDTISGLKDYSYVLDSSPSTMPDEVAEAIGTSEVLRNHVNDGNSSVLKYNGTGASATAYVEVKGNLTAGDVLRVTFYAAESHYDTKEEMAVSLYAIDNYPSSQDQSANITTIVNSSVDRSRKSLVINSDSYYSDITVGSGVTDSSFYVAIAGASWDNDNTYNLLIAGSNTTFDNSTQAYYCAASCTNMTVFFDYAVKVEQRNVKADNIWKKAYVVGDGVFYFHARAHDYANNWGSAQHYTIRVDTSAPSIPQMAEPSTYTATTSVSFNWTASTDIDSGVDNYYLEVSNSSAFTTTVYSAWAGNVTNKTVTASPDATYYARVRARNLAGVNSSWSTSVSTTVDTTAPTIVFSKPSGTIVTQSPVLAVETSERAICKYMKGSNPYINFSYTNVTYHETVVGADSGSNTFTVQCSDEIGNTRQTTLTFTVSTASTADSVTITPSGGTSAYAGKIATINVTVSSGGTGLGEIPPSSFNLSINNQQWPASVNDLGQGVYSLKFIAPQTNGTYSLGATVGRVASSTYTLNVNYYILTASYQSSGMSPNDKEKLTYVSTDQYSLGIASDSAAVYVSSSASTLKVAADSSTGDIFLFVTRKSGDVDRVESLLKNREFMDKLNPSFGYQIDEDKYIVYTSLKYGDIALTGNETLEAGRYSLIVENKGFDSTLNKTKLEVRVS